MSGGGTDQRGSMLAAHHASLSSPVGAQEEGGGVAESYEPAGKVGK